MNTSFDLPSYSPSVPAPLYSCEPSLDEQRLQLTPGTAATRRTPNGSYIKKNGKITVILNEQEEGIDYPSYGRHGPINGTLLVDDSEMVTEVEVKIEGKLDTTTSETGGKSTPVLRERHILWSKQNAGPSNAPSCPSQLPFAFGLPSTFKDGDADRPLPPSYSVFCHGVPTLFLKTTYTIRIAVTRVVHQKLGGLWTKTKHLLVPFQYVPRTRAHRPILPVPSFFSSIKTSPEEWFQAVSTIKPRATSSLTPVNCHLFIPAGRVYGIKDTIPFHLQLSGRVSSLRELFAASSSLDRVISTDSSVTASSKTAPEAKAVIRVSLMRQVSVDLHGHKGWRNITLCEGTLSSVPPLMSTCYSPASPTREEHLDWEGELRCEDGVKDFVTININPTPGRPSKVGLMETQVSVPIRLVTDSYGDYGVSSSQ
ncbi:hypothetical protein DFP72DRAFT_989896 [Ephemerocybe angulata]|uniref:Uncharacterized protein n=1 Tax=Ephemerocybe angulata TaxID=980116 RepID=A0A8H6HYW2_9AGAR|nr:hypothetical protein DFP72DRAFT_989896 [Tulosesus angulatus]